MLYIHDNESNESKYELYMHQPSCMLETAILTRHSKIKWSITIDPHVSEELKVKSTDAVQLLVCFSTCTGSCKCTKSFKAAQLYLFL